VRKLNATFAAGILLAAILLPAGSSSHAQALGSLPMTYSGRLTESSGAPKEGPVEVVATFWTAEFDGTQLGQNFEFPAVPLNQGVFSLYFPFLASQVQDIFRDGSEPVFIEIAASGKTYPRQKFNFIPLAMRIPVDNKTLSFDTLSGKLGISGAKTASSGSVLVSNGNGGIAWDNLSSSNLSAKTLSGGDPSANQVLTYKNGKWVAASLPASSASGNYITDLFGDVVATGPGSGSATLAPVALPGTATKVTFDAKGRVMSGTTLSAADITAALGFSPASNVSITAGSGLSGGQITNAGTISLADTTVSAGTYTRANITVDAQGRITEAQSAPAIADADISPTANIAQSKISGLAASLNAKETAFNAGTSQDYFRGDKTWQALNTATVPEAGTALYFSNSRARSSLSGAAPIDYSSTTGTISIGKSTGTSNGYLSSTDWTAFNGKQDSLGYSPVNKAGDTMSGILNMNGQTVTGLPTPAAASDAASKAYVDTANAAMVKRDGTAALTGPWAVGNDLTSVGNLSMTQAKTLGLGVFTDASEATMTASLSASGATSPDKGKTWFNKDTNQVKYWDGSSVKALGVSGAGLTNLNGLTANTQSFGVGASGNGPAFSSDASTHTLNIPMAAAGASVTAGLISNAEYAALTSKISGVTGTGGVSVTMSSGTATVSLANIGTAGTYAKVITNSTGQVVGNAALVSGDIPNLDANKITTGQISVANGGTGILSGTSGGLPYFSGVSTMASSMTLTSNGIVLGGGVGGAPTATAALTNGQLLIGSTGNAPVAATLSSGANGGVTVTSGAGTITLDTPQDIKTSASPNFSGLTLNGLAASSLLKTNASKALVAAGASDITGTLGFIPANKAGDTFSGAIIAPMIQQNGTAQPALSAAGQGAIYFDTTSNMFKISQNGAAYIPLLAAGTVTSVNTGTGLTGGPITGSGTVSIADTTVTPGAYTRANITVDQQGRLTAAASAAAIVDADIAAGAAIAQSKVAGLSTSLSTKENSITSGTTSQYFRGDKSWQALTTAVVTEGGTNLYYTDARARSALAGSGPITYGVVDGTIGITQANASSNGYLSSTDWSTFSGKQNALGYTPLNRAGDSMSGVLNHGGFDITNTGNIQMAASKTFALSANASDPAGLGTTDKGKTWFDSTNNQIKYWNGSAAVALGVAGSGLTSLGGQSGSTQTFGIPGNSGTGPAWSSASNIHTLNIPMASAASVTAGLLSNADYTAFTSKINAVTQGTGISVSTASGTATVTLANTAVTAGSYSRANITVDAQGRLTGAVNGGNVNLASEVTGVLPATNGGTGVNSTATYPATGVVVTRDAQETLTNKTLTAPVVSSLVNTGTLTLPTTTDTLVGRSTTDTLTNKTLAAATINGASSIGGSTTINTTGTATTGALTATSVMSQGDVTIRGSGTATNKLVLNDKTNTNFVAFKAPDTLASQLTWELPGTNGSAGQVLSTNGTGTLSWVSGVAPTGAASGDLTGNFPGPTLAAVGTAGTYTKVTTDSKGRVTAGSALVAGDIPSLPASIITSGILSVANGGTGASTITNNGVVIGVGNSALSSVTGTNGQVMTVNGTNQPIFSAVNLGAAAAVSGTLAVANGGTGVTTGAANLMFATPSGSSGAPSLRALTAADLPVHSAALITSGTLGVANGGTGLTANPANGQIAIGNGTDYSLATLTAGSGISITNGSGSVNIASTVTPANYVAVAGSTMTGVLNLPADGLVAGTSQLVLANGNVGVGTRSPGQKLSVNGTIQSTTGGVMFPDGTTQSTAAAPGLTSCPSGFTMVGTSGRRGTFCIDSNERTAQAWLAAKDTCRGLSFTQGRAFMCSHSEWYTACQDAPAGLTNMTNGWEWVAEFNGNTYAILAGSGGCSGLNYYSLSYAYDFRCCVR